MRQGVAVTGIGLVTALGATREESWRRMVAGECGVRPVTVFGTEGYRSRVAAEVDISAVDTGLTDLRHRRHSRGDRIGLLAAAEALDDAGLMDGTVDRTRVGIFLGAGTGDLLRNEDFLHTWIESGIERSKPSDVWNHFLSTPVDAIASRFGFEGPRACVVAACSSGTIAIGRGVEAIRSGRADVVLAGATDALARLTFTGFNLLRLMDSDPCRPFDRGRAGMNIGEGAGVLVLETLEHARRRGARVHAELAGHALACEAFHPTAPEPEGRTIATVISLALADAETNADEVDHVNAHGTATPQNDAAEARGLHRVFGDRAAQRAGDRNQVDGGSLPRRVGCRRSGGPRADHRPRSHSADDPSRRNRPRLSNRHRGQSGPRGARALRSFDVARIRRQRFRDRDARGRSITIVVAGFSRPVSPPEGGHYDATHQRVPDPIAGPVPPAAPCSRPAQTRRRSPGWRGSLRRPHPCGSASCG